jgi:hypothetical protein
MFQTGRPEAQGPASVVAEAWQSNGLARYIENPGWRRMTAWSSSAQPGIEPLQAKQSTRRVKGFSRSSPATRTIPPAVTPRGSRAGWAKVKDRAWFEREAWRFERR